MRPVLFRLLLDHPWQLWADNVEGVPGVGIALVVAILGAIGIAWILIHRGLKWSADDRSAVTFWLVTLVLLTAIPPRITDRLGEWFPTASEGPSPDTPVVYTPTPVTSLPLFGYGFCVLLGFLAAKWLGERRARRSGLDLATIYDLMFWTLICCVAGGRLFYITQYSDEIFEHAHGVLGHLFAAVNLAKGGLVLIGAMLGGAVGFFGYCRLARLPALAYLDALTPSIFLAVAFGRVGCLMYGCCFGDPSTLPWAVSFGPDSAAYKTLDFRGFLPPHAACTMPLHPTQLYSALNGLLLTVVTCAYTPFRPRIGSVFALGMILYPLTRFFIEFVRADELGQLGTGLTISQLLSLAMLGSGLLLAWRLQTHGSPPPDALGQSPAQRTAA